MLLLDFFHPPHNLILDFGGVEPDAFIFLHDPDVGLDDAEEVPPEQVDVMLLVILAHHQLLYPSDDDFVAILGVGLADVLHVEGEGFELVEGRRPDHDLVLVPEEALHFLNQPLLCFHKFKFYSYINTCINSKILVAGQVLRPQHRLLLEGLHRLLVHLGHTLGFHRQNSRQGRLFVPFRLEP